MSTSTTRRGETRPSGLSFQRLIADAMDHLFDCVLVFHTCAALLATRSRPSATRSSSAQNWESTSSRSPSRSGQTTTTPPPSFAESINEIFDEYASVTLSFWTRMGLHEKMRQGYLTGSLPWGYTKGADGIAQPDPERAPLIEALYRRYSTGEESDRSLAAWLNAQGARTTRGRPFSTDTVRELLQNAAYCGYVSGRRDKSKAIRGPTRRDHRRGSLRPRTRPPWPTTHGRATLAGLPIATSCAASCAASAAKPRCTEPP